MGNYLQNPLFLVMVFILILLALAIILILALRSRGRNQAADEARARREFEATGRENQFTAAIAQTEFQKDAGEAAGAVAALLADHLAMPLLAVYAGREEDDRLTNILPRSASGDTNPLVALPDAVPAAIASEYWRPQTIMAAALVGRQPDELPTWPATDEETGGQEIDAQSQLQPQTGGELQGDDLQGRVFVFPWRGAFGWGGLMATRASEALNADALTRYREPLTRLGNLLAVGLEMERRRGDISASDRRVLGAFEFSRSVVSALDKSSPLAIINSHLPGLFQADSAAIWSVDPNAAMVKTVASYGLGATEFLPLPVGQGLAGLVAQSGQPLAVEDAPSDPRCLFPREAQEAGVVSYLGAPMVAAGQTVGVVEVHTSSRRAWGENDARLLEAVAAVLAEVVRGTEARSNKLRVENAYLGLADALQRLRSRDEVLEAAVEVLGHALNVSRAFVIEFNELGQPEPVRREYCAPGVTSVIGTAFREDLLNRVTAASANGGPILIADSRSRSLMGAEMVSALDVYSEMALPLKMEGQGRALIYLHQCGAAREWQPSEVEFAQRVGQQLSLSLGNARAFEATAHEVEAAKDEARRAREARTRAQGVLESLPEMFLAADAEGKLALYNLTARDRLGLRNEDLGRPIIALEQLAIHDRALWQRILSSEASAHFASQLARPGAAPAPVSIAVTPMRNDKGAISGHLILMSDVGHLGGSLGSAVQAKEIEQRLAALERALSEARAAEAQARAALDRLQPAVNEARAGAEEARRAETEIRRERDQLREDQARVAKSAQQLIDINRLKSEFIVNAGREMEGSLQSLIGFADQMERGDYGQLAPEQLRAVQEMKGWAQRLAGDVDSLIEYGSTRSRRSEE